ncbi:MULTISPECIES: riboflavin synthase [unclassified Clostridium]|uniref:riboflavin synthase n=1 Tax=unclassified Clostridium TaxID=2614128 RepID=UPI000ED9C62E|nr:MULTISPECIES: riboflavin synthase [unclassified Clostridium]HCQ89567.1 riboflavin synthase [Clostridium sp.]
MFTGIIEEIGTIKSVRNGSKSSILTIECKEILEDTKIGDSIAVNGVCLTVTDMAKDGFTADVMSETMNRSTLGNIGSGSKVNLERAMLANGRFGGHMVSGHIDGIGCISHIRRDDNAVWYTITTDKKQLCYIVEKGSIAIDGISLTIACVDEEGFKVSIIPHTQKETILSYKKIGDKVNLECDMVGKYIEKLLKSKESENNSKITEQFLIEHGF